MPDDMPITIEKFAELSGYTREAVRSKVKRKDWPKGEVWVKAPDGRILISPAGFAAWARRGEEKD